MSAESNQPVIGRTLFDMRQPDMGKESKSSSYYYRLANTLMRETARLSLLKDWPEQVVVRSVLGVVGYFQDVVADCGVWRSFVEMNKRLYSRYVPFFEIGDDYIEHELNKEDVRFVTWYSLALNYEEKRIASPFSSEILEAADAWFEILQSRYDDAPVDEAWTVARGLEINNPEEAREVFRFSNWLFMYCYLMSPAYSMTLLNIMKEPKMQTQDATVIEQRIEQSMMEDPTGPLALYLKEWLYLILENRLPEDYPRNKPEQENQGEHPYYTKFIEATGGERIAFFGSYSSLNDFLVEKLGWSKDEEHLPQLKNEHDFVLLVDPAKGMLLAKNISRCICYPANPFYDKEYARDHAMDLLTVRGLCPADLLHFINSHNALPDARFADSDDTKLVSDNFDFIARCYLQLYYRGD